MSKVAYVKGSAVASPSTKRTFAGASSAPGLQELGSRVDRDDLADVSSEREREGAGARAGIERDLTPREGPQESAHAVAELARALFLERESQLDAHERPSLSERLREREGFLAGGDRSGCALLVDDGEDTSDLRAGRQTELVPSHERLGRIGPASLLDFPRELGRTDERERIERPRLRRATKAMDRTRRLVLGPACTQQRCGISAEIPRDGERTKPLAKDDDEPEVRIVQRVERSVERPAERLEQPELREAAEARR